MATKKTIPEKVSIGGGTTNRTGELKAKHTSNVKNTGSKPSVSDLKNAVASRGTTRSTSAAKKAASGIKTAKPINKIVRGGGSQITTPGFKSGTKVKKTLY